MTLPPLASDMSTIVVTGAFKPIEITPAWMREQELISDAEFNKVEYELLIPGEAVTFRSGWLRCQINPQAIQFETSEESEFERLRDLAVEVLHSMPQRAITQMGMNRIVHISIKNKDMWHAIGDHLVNNKMWDKVLNLAGMRVVTFWGTRTDGYGGRINVQIEPSAQFQPGIFVSYNDHYDLTVHKKVPNSRADFDAIPGESAEASIDKIDVAIKILNENWGASARLFYDVLDAVWQQGRAQDA